MYIHGIYTIHGEYPIHDLTQLGPPVMIDITPLHNYLNFSFSLPFTFQTPFDSPSSGRTTSIRTHEHPKKLTTPHTATANTHQSHQNM